MGDELKLFLKSAELTPPRRFAKLGAMSLATRKFIAVLMLLWLPLSGSSALAVSLSMSAQPEDCHEMMEHELSSHDMGGHVNDGHAAQDDEEQEHASCNACGACHLACSIYLGAPQAASFGIFQKAQKYPSLLVSFDSFITAPLLPPPLSRI